MAMRGYGYDTITEGSSGLYTATLATPGGTAVTAVMLTALSLTLYDKETGAIVNSRDAQDVLNKGNVTIDAEGEIAWSIQPADTVILDATKEKETRVALFHATWNTGSETGEHRWEYTFQVDKLGPAE